MIRDNVFIAEVGEDTIVVSADAAGENIHVRTTNNELKRRFLSAVNNDYQVQLTPVNPKTYPTGKNTPLEIAASLASISSALQFVKAPDEVIAELKRITALPGNHTEVSIAL